jgi:hypothetical protein
VQCALAVIMMTVTQFYSLKESERHRVEQIRVIFKVLCGVALGMVCLIHTNHLSQKTYMESAWMLPTLCIILACCVAATHIRAWGQDHHGQRKKVGDEENLVPAEPTEPVEQTETAEPAGRTRVPRPKRVATPDAFV